MTSTGFLTTKGSLVRDILYPREITFEFYADGLRFVGIMAALAIIGFACVVPVMVNEGTATGILIDRSLDLLTICVPPALPAAMTCGVVFAINRLKEQKIFCISPNRVNVAGRISTYVFDKTGTITEDSLSVMGSRTVSTENGVTSFSKFESDSSKYQAEGWWTQSNALETREKPHVLFQEALASTTEITYVNDVLVGDPLDVKMFEATKWVLKEPNQDTKQDDNVVITYVQPPHNGNSAQSNYKSAIIRRFEFSSALQRMSVLCKNEFDNRIRAFVKGSPEMISSLCRRETLPTDFKKVLEDYTKEGYRVIALSQKLMPEDFKYLKAQKVKREEVESDLEFLGLLIMENKLKA